MKYMVCFVRLLCHMKRSFGMTGWLKRNHHASPPKARGAAGTMVLLSGGTIMPSGGVSWGGGWRGMVYGSQPIYPSGMPRCMPER